ncbi:MAG: hypothetical protein ACK42C_02865 [Aquificaceae bacterium]|jgi:hypothetical protein|uniref:hypothetical protein n=1 Tax=Hydrogenobacter sp. Uz 6-8 TaxID=3384828 RepID=UPI00309CFCBF
MQEFIARGWEERFDRFAKAEPVGGESFICAGLFYNRHEPYLQNLANLMHGLINRKVNYDGFNSALEKADYRVPGRAIYSRSVVNRWRKPFRLVKYGKDRKSFYRHSEGRRFLVEDLRVGNPSDLDRKSGVVFMRIRGYEDVELSREVEWQMRKDLLQVWLELSGSDIVRQYLQEVMDTIGQIEGFYLQPWDVYSFRRLFFYLLPLYFDHLGNSKIVSRASLFERREETRLGLWQEIEEKLKDEKLYEDLSEYMQDLGKSLEDTKSLLERALSPDTLKALQQDWKLFLKKALMGESSKLSAQVLIKEDTPSKVWVSFGEYLVPNKNIELYLFHEAEISQEDIDLLERELKTFSFAQGVSVSIVGKYSLERLFGGQDFISLIKGTAQKGRPLRHIESTKLLYSLLHFCARLISLQRQIEKDHESFRGVLILLNTELEEGEMYEFWNAVSFLYDYFGLPVQTVTRRTLNKLRNNNQKETAKKNLLISLYKDAKVLKFDFDGFSLPERVTIYAVLEKPSSAFFYAQGEKESGIRHGLYEVYRVRVEGKSATVEVENKFLLMGGGYNEDAQELERFVREGLEEKEVRFCFISSLKDSYLKGLYDRLASHADYQGKLLSLRYKELKTAYLSKKEEEGCLVIYTQQFRKLIEGLGIHMEEDAAVIGIKPSRPQREEDFYHPAFQLFFTEKIGWDREEVYSERKNLFLFTLIALSMFESEAAHVAYAKLNLWSKERNTYLRIDREDHLHSRRIYTFALSPLLYEMLEFIKHLPGDDKIV